jgi:hypothetical protein
VRHRDTAEKTGLKMPGATLEKVLTLGHHSRV